MPKNQATDYEKIIKRVYGDTLNDAQKQELMSALALVDEQTPALHLFMESGSKNRLLAAFVEGHRDGVIDLTTKEFDLNEAITTLTKEQYLTFAEPHRTHRSHGLDLNGSPSGIRRR